MSLTKEGYRPRLIDTKMARYLRIFGAVSIEGLKWCGKTWTSLNHANSVAYVTVITKKANLFLQVQLPSRREKARRKCIIQEPEELLPCECIL